MVAEHTNAALSRAEAIPRRRVDDRARELSREKISAISSNTNIESPETMQKLVHQLQVHQIELEMQNEELRRTQWELETARLRYFDLYDLAPVGYCTLSEEGLILEANLMAATLFDCSRGALAKQRISNFILTADQDIYYLHRKQLLETGTPQSFELRIMSNTDTPRWVKVTTTTDKDVNGVALLRMVMTDISENKHSEQVLRTSEERYRNLFNSIDEGFCVVEMIYENEKPIDYRFLEVNPSFEKQSGLHNATGKRILEMAPDFDSFWIDVYSKVALTGEPIRITNEAKKMDRWFDVYAFRVGEAGSEKVAIIFNNITERMLVEAERTRVEHILHDYTLDLERATEIAETATIAAEKATAVAEKANLAKSEFLSSMSHELRTPLSAILGFAQLIETGTPLPTEKQKRNLDQILRAGWYLLDLINEILDLALIESGKLSLSLESVALAEVLRDCQTLIEPQAEKQSVNINFLEIDTPHVVHADRTRLKQILINLLSNAIKYNKPAGSVTVHCIAQPLGRIRICVTDTGEGLAAEKIAQLFQPFNRLGQENNVVEGTGIGLVMTKRLIELMGGEIGLESKLGEGSTFWVEMHLTTQAVTDCVAVETLACKPEKLHTDMHTLLYVEDNPANLMLIEDIMARRPNTRLLTALDGTSGIALARATQPDVILMDINLPGISGIQALKILAADPTTAHIPVIALSANAMQSDIEKGIQAGFFRYLTKPIKINEFMTTLDTALEHSSTN
jgi:PAS domain S-box-containing protein